MKKFFTLFLLLALLSTCAVAADEPLPCQNPCMNYVDTDGDGVCDNAGQANCMRSGRGMGCGRMMRCNSPFLRRGGCRRGW